jgi:hypothetical protein
MSLTTIDTIDGNTQERLFRAHVMKILTAIHAIAYQLPNANVLPTTRESTQNAARCCREITTVDRRRTISRRRGHEIGSVGRGIMIGRGA